MSIQTVKDCKRKKYMGSFGQDYYYQDDERLFGGDVDIFNLTCYEAGNAFSINEMTDVFKDYSSFGNYKAINGLLIFTLSEFPGLVVDILSTNNYVVKITRQIIHSLNGPQRRPVRA
jgi:hypothetical protein